MIEPTTASNPFSSRSCCRVPQTWVLTTNKNRSPYLPDESKEMFHKSLTGKVQVISKIYSTHRHRNSYKQMLATALFVMAGNWTWSNVYLLLIGLLWCGTSPQWVSLINMKELLIHETMWVRLEGKVIKWWKPETKVPTPSGFIYMTF